MDLTNLRESLESTGDAAHETSSRLYDERLTNEFRGTFARTQEMTKENLHMHFVSSRCIATH